MNPVTTKLWTFVIVGCLTSGSFLIFLTGDVLAETNYTMLDETVNKGYSTAPSNRNAEDASYNSLVEGDQYSDANFSASSENMIYGTAWGGAFPSSLDTDDGIRRNYTEENTEGTPPDDYELFLYPNGNVLDDWNIAVPGVDHYLNVDETTEGGDDGATYVEASSNGVVDRFAMADMSDPGVGYTLNVSVFAVHYKGSSQPNSFQAGIRISTTDYEGFDVNPSNGDYTNDTSDPWLVNPATTSAWTYSEINLLVAYITTDDASPNVRCTQVGLQVMVNFTAVVNYELDAEITFSSVVNTSQTTGYKLFCQANRSGTENFDIYAWDIDCLGWNLKETIDQSTEINMDFDLTVNEYNETSNEVLLRVLGKEEVADDCQCTVSFDILKVGQINKGYSLDVELTSTTVAAYGNITLRIKGYTSAEAFQVDIYNYTATDWDTNELEITDLGNDWQATIDLNDTHHRSGQSVKARFVDTIAEASDTTQDTLYLDVVWATLYFTDPVASNFGADPVEVVVDNPIVFYLNYTDYDNQVPTYVYVFIDSTNFALSKNDSGDSSYHDGVNYSLSKSDLDAGEYEYYFKIKDAESGEITTTPDIVTVTANGNEPPYFTSTPSATGHNNTLYYYDANALDDDEDPLTYDLEGSITGWASIVPSTGVVQGTPTVLDDYWMNVSVTDGTFVVWQNTSVHIYTDAPNFETTAITTWQNGTTYQYNAEADDPESEQLIFGLEGNGSAFISIPPPDGDFCLLSGPITVMGWWYLNLSVTDGTNFVWQNFSLTALNSAPYFTTDPVLTGRTNVSYSYSPNATDNNSDVLIYSIDSSPIETLDWLTYNISTGALEGTPTVNRSYDVNLSITDTVGVTTWQNFSITIEIGDGELEGILLLVLALCFCFGIMLAGFKERMLLIMAGFVWMFCGIAIFIDYGDAFVFMSVGIGAALLIKGAYDVWN